MDNSNRFNTITSIWYDSSDEAIKTAMLSSDKGLNKIKEYYDGSNEITRLETDKELVIICISPKHIIRNDIYIIKFQKKDGRYSLPYFYIPWPVSLNEWGDFEWHYYELDDAVAENIITSIFLGLFVESGDGNNIYYGFWDNESEIKSLTINGIEPDGIISFIIGEKKYYMWYYAHDTIKQNLLKIDLNDFTLQEVIDVLEIKYNKQDNRFYEKYHRRKKIGAKIFYLFVITGLVSVIVIFKRKNT